MQKRILLLVLLVYLMLVITGFGTALGDGKFYSYTMNYLLGEVSFDVLRPVFSWRILLILVALPFVPIDILFADTYHLISLSVSSAIGGLLFIIVLYKLLFGFTDDERKIGAVIIILLASLNLNLYIATPLVTMWMMFFLTLVTYLIVNERDWRLILGCILIGVLAKETMLFMVLFYFAYHRDLIKTSIIGITSVSELILWRITTFGTIVQPLGFTLSNFIERPISVVLHLTWGLGFIVPIALMNLESLRDKRVLKIVCGLFLSLLPIVYLGLFHACFDIRFIMPLLIPLSIIAVANPSLAP